MLEQFIKNDTTQTGDKEVIVSSEKNTIESFVGILGTRYREPSLALHGGGLVARDLNEVLRIKIVAGLQGGVALASAMGKEWNRWLYTSRKFWFATVCDYMFC